MKYWILVLALLTISTASAVTYLTPGTITGCMTDGASNTTYCAAYPNYNVNKELNFNETWKDPNTNVNLTCKAFPKINENISFNYEEGKTWNDYNLTATCVRNRTMETVVLSSNTTFHSDLKKVHIECATGIPSANAVVKDMLPGEAYYSIRCLPYINPIQGTIYLYPNTTFNENWSFTSDQGECIVGIKPSSLFTDQLQFATRYSDCMNNNAKLQQDFSDSDRDKSMLIGAVFIIGIGGFIIAFLYFKDTFGGKTNFLSAIRGEMKKPPKEELENRQKEKTLALDEQKETAGRDLSYYRQKYKL